MAPCPDQGWLVETGPARPWRRILTLLSVCGLIELVLCLLFLRTERECRDLMTLAGEEDPTRVLAENETGAFAAWRREPDDEHRPTFHIRWKNLRSKDGRVGILSTPLYKTVTVEGLEVQTYEYSRADEARRDNPASVQSFHDLGSRWKEAMGGLRLESPLLDIRRATRVVVRDLEYSAFRDGQLELGVRCYYAAGGPASSQIVLRGAVTIQTGDGTLVAGCVHWDVETSQIAVPGTYMLTRDGVSVRGRGLRCDLHWRSSVEQEVNSRKGAGKWAEAVSF